MVSLALAALVVLVSHSQWVSFAAEPSGSDWFEFHANPFTGADETGDGGTGNTADLNYYYVGQSFDTTLAIASSGATAANVWVDYDTQLAQVSDLTTGGYFNSWDGQLIENGRIKSTGFNLPATESNGLGDFGAMTVTLLRPTAIDYGMGSPGSLDIQTGQIGHTTESNIAFSGMDLLDDAEDFQFHVWADTKKPYAANSVPADESEGVSVESDFAFELRDSLNGEGDDSGVGTGVDINTPERDVLVDDGTGPVSLKSNISPPECSGVWGSNLCTVTLNVPSITTYPGDSRKWDYNTTYTVEVSGYADLASSNQDQLGEANGPNAMNPADFTFTTEADGVAPEVDTVTPQPNSVDQPLDSVATIEVIDRQVYPDGMSGSGVDVSTCHIDVTSASQGVVAYDYQSADVSIIPIDYGYRFVIDPETDFVSNETVRVDVTGCADIEGNVISERSYEFSTVILDSDGDTVLDSVDNCPVTPNADQYDLDSDGAGDACDSDIDGDTVLNEVDNCPLLFNDGQEDLDSDGLGDECDDDVDGDSVDDAEDNCPLIANTDQSDLDEDGAGDSCDTDLDGDTVPNVSDNCPVTPNLNQVDFDGDGIGDACSIDLDGDTIPNEEDNCPATPNTDQADNDEDGSGDLCDDDDDNDTVLDAEDNCPIEANTSQSDVDGDGLGDTCDSDADGDTVQNDTDNCPLTPNTDQSDVNGDGVGDACQDDADGDGILNEEDNCPLDPNTDQEDFDEDGIGDVCDSDVDGDTFENDVDNCPLIANENQKDFDEDGQGDVCDDDADNDTILNEADNCPLIPNLEQEDLDNDGFGDDCDIDMDDDTFVNQFDNCPRTPNPDQEDFDEDGIGDLCDIDVGFVAFIVSAKPEKRATIDDETDLSLESDLDFFSLILDDVQIENGPVVLDGSGIGLYTTDQLTIGDYHIALKGDVHLSRIVRDFGVESSAVPLSLDYTFANTFELIAGDIYTDDRVNSFDLTTMLGSYMNREEENRSDLNKDGVINAADAAILILNYFKQGETF